MKGVFIMKTLLNTLLADLVVSYHKLQSFHWYLKGYHFFDDHKQLEEYYDMLSGLVDSTAEHMLQLGMKPESTMKGFLALSSIEEAHNEEVTSEEAYTEVKKDFEQLLSDVLAVKKKADEDSDYLSSALMDDYMKEFYKALWMLRQVLK
jgi:starvation-inducible DNA-binding protein